MLLEEAYRLGISKNRDYGMNNILRYGTIGIIVRLGDKLSRVKNLYASKASAKAASLRDENAEDTLLDVVNYTTYAIMLLHDVWS